MEQANAKPDYIERLFKETGLRISTIQDIKEAPPLEFIVQDLIIQGFVHFLSAPPGTGKSIFSISLGRSIASRKPFLGTYNILKSGLVLIVDSENSSSLSKDHVEKMEISNDLTIEFLHFQDIRFNNRESFENLLKVIEDRRPVLTVFDSMIRFHDYKENEPNDMRKLSEKFHMIIESGTTVFALHHSPVKKTSTHITRGTGEIPAGCDIEYGMIRDAHNIITFKSYKTRIGDFEPIKLKIIKPTDHTLDIIKTDRYVNHFLLKEVKKELADYIKQQGRSLNQTEFSGLIERSHPETMKQKEIARLIEDGIRERYWIFTRGDKNAKFYQPRDTSCTYF